MNVLIYGNETDKDMLMQHMKEHKHMAFRLVNYSQTNDYNTFLDMLNSNHYEIVFVMEDNAAGMEGVMAVQNLHPEASVIWFSNDKNFVAQSYRLGVSYFATKPINEKIIGLALNRCRRREAVIYEQRENG